MFAIADGYGDHGFLGGSYGPNGNGSGAVTGGTDDVIDFGGFGTGNGSQGPLGAPTYDPPGRARPDDPNEDDHS